MSLARYFEDRRQFRRVARELNSMTARELNDLGLSRADIPAVARQSVR
ncbi:DUF1127 domain-containing protein [Aureimonas sp. AU20]|nr:DUF1127 domain-containing protein [Aureimonas sp. AU20]ALN75467.1 hypothetical protein M673_22255 [Aureimonas sp. AU20]